MQLNPLRRAPGGPLDDIRAEFDALYAEHQSRLGRYTQYESEYERSRNGEVNNGPDDYGRSRGGKKMRHSIPLNLQHAITQKHAFRIAGRLPDIVVPRADNSNAERFRGDTMEKVLYACHRYSKAPLQFASGAHHASLLGAACFDVYYNLDRQMPRYRELHPGGILVVPGVDDPHDFERVYRFWTVSRASFEAKYKGIELPDNGTLDDVKDDVQRPGNITIIQMSDRQRTIRFASAVKLEELQHGYGFTPYVVIPNLGPIEKVWGYADYEFFRDLVLYYEQLNNRMADVASGVAGGAIQDFGSGQTPEKLLDILRKGGIIPVKKDSSGLKPVEVPQFGNWIDAHFQAIRQAVNDTSFTPPASWGELGAATSGSDRALQLGAQLELTGLKQIHWTRGLQRINEMMLRMIEQKQIGRAVFRGVQTNGHRSSAFTIVLDAAVQDAAGGEPEIGIDGQPKQTPTNPQQLIAGDYDTDIVWQNRLERDDPQFVLQELNKFQQGVQSLYTTLERLGFADPDEEMKLIEAEATRFPWLRSGMIALIKQQLDAGNQAGGGASGVTDPNAAGGDLSSIIASMGGGGGGQSGALTLDALGAGLNGSANGGGRSAGSVPGQQYGGA